MRPRVAHLVTLAVALAAVPHLAAGAEIRDVVDVAGVRSHFLLGYGVVVGLDGTGDTGDGAAEAVRRHLAWGGMRLSAEQLRSRSAALVMLSAELPPFAGQGQRLDVQVSAVGDARSLRGGRLLVAPLYAGKPENVIARAQGSLWFSGQAEPAVPTSATLPDGAVVERAVPTRFLDDSGAIRLLPRRGDITAAQAVAEAVNQGLDRSAAVAVNGGLVVVRMTQAEAADPVAFLSTVLQLPVDLTIPATVVIDSQTGTVTMTAQAMVRPCAFAHGDVVIRIGEPSGEGAAALPAEGVRLRDLVDQLNRAGVAPRDLAAILQGLARAGALQAELVVE